MLNFVICDDNLNILDRLSKMLESIFAKHSFEAQISFKSDDVERLLDFVENNKTDVLVLDINLKSNKTGLEVAELVRKKNKDAYIIFTTAHLEYAMMAYKFKTFDYLAKPITSERIEETVIRLFEDIHGLPKKYIKIDNKNTIVDESEIEYIKRDGMKILFHTLGRDYDAYSSFNKIQEQLPEHFYRCHKSYIVNLKKVVNMDPVNSLIYFEDGSSCNIGPKYKKELMEVIKQYGNIK